MTSLLIHLTRSCRTSRTQNEKATLELLQLTQEMQKPARL